MKPSLILAIFFQFHFSALFSQTIYITDVTIIDVKSGKSLAGKTVIVKGSRIEQVIKAGKIKIPSNAQIIDGRGKYLLPGMTDAHIHFFQSGGLYTRPDVIDFRNKVPYENEKEFGLQNAADYLRRYLRLGVTTVIDVGGPMSNFTVRDSIAKTTVSPDVLVTGPLFSMVERPQFGDDLPIINVTNEQEVDALFQKILPHRPDFIKIWYIAGPDLPAEKNFPLVKYIAEQTKKNGLKLTVHATELNTARLAVEAGADILVHSVSDEIIPDDIIKKWKEKRITYIPTLLVGTNYIRALSGKLPNHPQDLAWANAFAYNTLTDLESMSEAELPPRLVALRKSGKIPTIAQKEDSTSDVNLVKLVRAGVNVATGTDAGNIGTFHASSYLQELEAMQKAGLTNIEILKASTINAAIGFGREQQWGSIEKDKVADFLLLDRNPLDSLQNLNSVKLIFKNGRILRADSIIQESPEAIVQRQIIAYNARNIYSFLDTYSDSVELYDFPNKVWTKGKEAMRKNYKELFRQAPNLFCQTENRIAMGNIIIDKEKVRAARETIHASAIYEIQNGKIRKVTFIQ
jgi:imidazolonepropionase-like amidohydrolase